MILSWKDSDGAAYRQHGVIQHRRHSVTQSCEEKHSRIEFSTSKSTLSRYTSRQLLVKGLQDFVPTSAKFCIKWRYDALRHTLLTDCSISKLNCVFSDFIPLMKSHAHTCLIICASRSAGVNESSCSCTCCRETPRPAPTSKRRIYCANVNTSWMRGRNAHSCPGSNH